MEPFRPVTAIAVPIKGVNVDTDQILPARFLKFDRSAGYGRFLFHDLRFDDAGNERPEFILNDERFRSAEILVAGENFGCGSSREGAAYALHDFGIRAVIAPSFGDIFYNNCLRNGLLPATVPAQYATELRDTLLRLPDPRLTVDLEALTITDSSGAASPFTLGSFWRDCLLRGVDEIGLALRHTEEIEAFERERSRRLPWLS
ncbi:MAG: 3-isopropylmalate dehydratase small subunit [Steroidobacteraceae bacterium]